MLSSIAALPAPRSRAMLGSASCTIIASSTVMKLPASSTVRPSPRRRAVGASAIAIGTSIAQVSLDAMAVLRVGDFRLDDGVMEAHYGTASSWYQIVIYPVSETN